MRTLLLFLALMTDSALAQRIERSVLSSAGGALSNGSLELSTTVGQLADEVRTTPSLTLEEGFQPTTGYEHWAAGFPGLGGPNDDPDGDKRSNVVEYGLGGNPLLGDPQPDLLLVFSAGGFPELSVAKGDPAGRDAQVVYRVEVSSTLIPGSWSGMNLVTQVENATVLVARLNTKPTNAFFRLCITVDSVTP